MEFLNLLKSWDKDLFLFLNGIHSPLWDYSMTLFTLTPIWILFYGTILFIIGKKYGKKSLFIFVSVILLILFADQFSNLLKHTVQRLRPSNDPAFSQLVHVFFRKGGLYGFVSAHAANTFAIATFTSLLFRNRRYTAFILPWAMMIAYTRVYLGVHYPGDILGGALLGVGVGIGIFKLLNYAESRLSPVNLFARNPLKDREANRIIEVGLFVIIMCIGIVALLLQNDVIPH
ncbi:MAG: phosphatase PAP2 family protein [Bacteroidia bacterium]|nr:phosphatase PAP2 family protein [Bacteroidia bacterium]